jgi:steroid delta-isomerase
MDAAAKVEAVNKYIQAFDTVSMELIRELYADNATLEDPVGSEVRLGIDDIVAFYQTAFDMGAKLKLLGAPRCAGNSVAFPFQVEVGGMKIEAIDVFEFDTAGKVISMKAYWGEENATA